jgi:hypothetical protein
MMVPRSNSNTRRFFPEMRFKDKTAAGAGNGWDDPLTPPRTAAKLGNVRRY